MKNILTAYYKSEIGMIEITGTEEGITSVIFLDNVAGDSFCRSPVPECLQECVNQLDEYFNGKRKEFSLNVLLQGTDFQKTVWSSLRQIGYGQTVSYADIAEAIGNKKAVRAVGSTNGKNKINIIIPCHRVIGKDGSLTGYGGGLWRKEWLLAHEKRVGNLPT